MKNMKTRWLTEEEKRACPCSASVDVAIMSGGTWYYGDSNPTEEDPVGLEDAQYIVDEDGYYIPIIDKRVS